MTGEYPLDKLDREILKYLKENARYKNTEIASFTNKSEGAIRKRINKLVENGVIEKFTIEIAQQKDYGIWAIVQIEISGTMGPSQIREEIVKRIDQGIDTIFETAGDIDMIIIFHAENEIELQKHIESLRDISGIQDTTTHIVLTRTKVPDEIY